jgi:hypothetical protein
LQQLADKVIEYVALAAPHESAFGPTRTSGHVRSYVRSRG